MKYSCRIVVNQSLELVISRYRDPEGLRYWMDGFISMQSISGEPGRPGSKTLFLFKHRNKEIEIEETILEENYPEQIKYAYKSHAGYNEVEMIFEEISPNQVQIVSNNYFEFKGTMKLFLRLFLWTFKKQSRKHLVDFKAYAEANL